MTLTRREWLTAGCLTAATAGSGCLSSLGLRRSVRVNFSGQVHTEEPLVTNAGLFIEERYPHHYTRLITSTEQEQSEIRWDYIEEEIPLLVDDLEGTDFESGFLLFFGVVLPSDRRLQPDSPTKIDDGTLHTDYRIEDGGSASSEIAINTAIERVIHDPPPDDVTIGLRLSGSQ